MEELKPINKTDLDILMVLKHGEHTTFLKGTKCISVAEVTGLSISKVKKSLKEFIEKGYAALGSKDGKANTYYITKEGDRYIEDLIALSNKK